GYAGFALRPSGEQALANVLHIAELAREYDASGGISFRGFVERLREEADSGSTPEAPILEESSEGVRIMTVHKAKGLEFPVVILADITAKLSRSRASRYLDRERGLCAVQLAGWSPAELVEHNDEEAARDRAEGVRVAYVAATRARDLLVVPAVGDDPLELDWEAANGWWVSPLHQAIYPAPTRRRHPETGPAAGCPAFGKDSVLERPDGVSAKVPTVVPGLHLFPSLRESERLPPETSEAAGPENYGVVWWDPALLKLGQVPRFGIRRHELLLEGDRETVERDLAAYHAWQGERRATLEAGSKPSLAVRTVTERAAAAHDVALEAVPDVALIEVAHEVGRPAGPRYG
ncbi:MAG: 3'-5' exonuclease, partial [Thermoplasmata archaeon]